MTDKVLVVRTHEMERVKTFFEGLGLEFVEEQHGKGPVHYACEQNEHVLEIYPVGSKKEGAEFHG